MSCLGEVLCIVPPAKMCSRERCIFRLHSILEEDLRQVITVKGASLLHQICARSHGMRNELQHSNQVALDGLSWHVCRFDEEVSPCGLQARDYVRREVQ